MSLDMKTDWKVYVAICRMDVATPRDVVNDIGITVVMALSSIRRLAENGLVRNGGIENGRSVMKPVAWRELYDENRMAEMFGLEVGDLYLKGKR